MNSLFHDEEHMESLFYLFTSGDIQSRQTGFQYIDENEAASSAIYP